MCLPSAERLDSIGAFDCSSNRCIGAAGPRLQAAASSSPTTRRRWQSATGCAGLPSGAHSQLWGAIDNMHVGGCGDNAAMESFFALLQKNVLDHQRWATREELR